ncbi:TolC family protein [Desulfobulbus sp.]|uniref:TolC family protein n=1 Tax=Desulfobulbus sp. TaxID=895 RepID=UPI00286F6FF4|nr:TolC family protein [Desulfobulbus sp.]
MQRILVGMVVLISCLEVSARAAEQPAIPDLAKVKVLDLKIAQAVALSGNPDMAAAQARIEQARARVRQAAATWWPSLDASGSGVRQHLSENSYQYNRGLAALIGGKADQNTDVYSSSIQATWLLFDGFYRDFRERQALYGEQAAQAGLVDSQRMLVTAVAEAFLNAQLSQTYIDINRADATFYGQQLEDAQNRFKVGAGPWGDVLNIRVQVNSAKTSLIRSQREFEAAGYGLAALLGLPDASFPSHLRLAALDKETALVEQKEAAETLIKEAISIRPDIRQLEMVVKQAEAGTGMAKAPFYPKFQLGGAIEGMREGDARLTNDDFGNTVGVNMSWNLYAGGADKARVVEAEQAKREAVFALAGLRNNVAAEIRQDLAMLAASQEQVRLQRETVKLVEENRDLARNEYEAGEASLVRLNEAQRDLVTTYGRLAQALVGYHLAQQRLLASTGRNLAGFDQPAKERK